VISVPSILTDLSTPLPYPYYRPVVFMVRTAHVLKARLYISSDVFVQIYRNDAHNSTSFVLISAGQRIYARDQVRGIWHRHPRHDPHFHNHSSAGVTPVTLAEFLLEADEILKSMGIIDG
jgi:hypothetical protein